MSSTKVKTVSRDIIATVVTPSGVGPYVYTVTAPNHFLKSGDAITVIQTGNQLNGNAGSFTVTYISATQFSITSATLFPDMAKARFIAGFYSTGQTGGQASFTIPQTVGGSAIVQSYVVGTGAAAYNLEVSLDNSHWISLGTVTHTTVSNHTLSTAVPSSWVYARAKIASIGAATSLVLLASGG